MTDDELRELEAIAETSDASWEAEVVRPLGGSGVRGMRFETVAQMSRMADLIEHAMKDTATPGLDYTRRARLAVLVAMLRNGGQRSYELPPALT